MARWRGVMSAFAVIDRDLVRYKRVLGADTQDGAVGDHAILALVGGAGRHHDHLALGLGEPAFLLHQRVVIGEEGAELFRAIGQRQEHIRHEAGFFLHRQDTRADVLRQFFQRRRCEAFGG
jgi:hypothetical protein